MSWGDILEKDVRQMVESDSYKAINAGNPDEHKAAAKFHDAAASKAESKDKPMAAKAHQDAAAAHRSAASAKSAVASSDARQASQKANSIDDQGGQYVGGYFAADGC